jgi:MYXO-CTERM domain-containing protein
MVKITCFAGHLPTFRRGAFTLLEISTTQYVVARIRAARRRIGKAIAVGHCADVARRASFERRRFMRLLSALLASAVMMAVHAGVTSAAVVNYTIDSSLSSLTLSGNANGSTFTAQVPTYQTDLASYSGIIKADRGASTIQFVSGSTITAASRSTTSLLPYGIDPGPGPLLTSDPFDFVYAVRAPLAPMTDPVDTTTGYFTLFDLVFGATSASIPVSGTSFATSGITSAFTNGKYAYIRFGDLYENIPDSGNPSLIGLSSANAGSAGSLVTAAGIETLTLPIDLTYTSNNADGINVTYRLTGNLVATAVVPEPAGLTLVALGGFGLLRRRNVSRAA